MTPAEKAYNDYKDSVDNKYAGGLIPEITDYVTELERKNNKKDRQIERLKKIITIFTANKNVTVL